MELSQALLARYKDVVAPAIYRYTDLTFVRGEGAYLYDADGRRYLDFSAGIATMAVGHQHPRVVEAVIQQAQRLFHAAAHIGVMEPYVALLEKVRSLAPGRLKDGKGVLLNSGSEAVEAALKLARYVTGRSSSRSSMPSTAVPWVLWPRPPAILSSDAGSPASRLGSITSLIPHPAPPSAVPRKSGAGSCWS
jgi:4-aminobutyrate aminotransferase-like enzyme